MRILDNKNINAIRFLGVDAINNANSGHPGIVLGAAPMAYTLFKNHINVDVKNPKWFNRDRFILSAGHGSGMLYAINHLMGYDLTIDDLKNFRKIGRTPGHPEFGHTEGVETTSGPLGQGISNAVGMAIAESHLAARFNKDGFNLIDNYTYVIVGDGDLQEGVAMEAISLAGHLKLGKLIVLFDSNDIQLDGPTKDSITENHKMKFEAQGWNYLRVDDGENIDDINQAIEKAKLITDQPTIIEIKTIIGFGAPKQGTASVHGSPLGNDATLELRKKLNWELKPFEISKDIYDSYAEFAKRGSDAHEAWNKMFLEYQKTYPEDAKLFNEFLTNKNEIDLALFDQIDQTKPTATRNINGLVLDIISKHKLNVIGGSADLTSSTKAKGADGIYGPNNLLGRNINFGVREHAMGAIANGLTLSGLRSFTGAFFVFSDYMKPAMRLASIMNIPTIFVFTHDTVAVGEDGPTHQPIEQLAGLRSIPNMNVIRPADANETIASWKIAYEATNTPTTLVYTRQNVTNLTTTNYEGVKKGGYIVAKEEKKLDGILLAAGSEVSLAIEAKALLKEEGIDVRVVSMPSMFLYDKQDEAYKNKVLPKGVKTLAIEMAHPMPWYKYTNNVFGIETFGLSDKGNKVVEEFGFTKENIKKIFKNIK